MLARKALAGTAGAPKEYVEDVFSTWLHVGTGSTNTISNSIDISGEGGLVWIKGRGNAEAHGLFDTARGANLWLSSNTTDAETTYSGSFGVTAFNNNGFTMGTGTAINANGVNYVSWTFRKAKKFFDVVTYTGNGSLRTISHNLGSVPGCIIVKKTSDTSEWYVYHRSLTSASYALELNSTGAQSSDATLWNSTAPTSSVFSLGDSGGVNGSGATYVAYLFAHDAGGFGASGSDNVISCGSYTGNGSTSGPTITLGYEPQLIMIKRANGAGSWQVIDNMRGMCVNADDSRLVVNSTTSEITGNDYLNPTATGFDIISTSSEVNTNASTYIYIAIRRGPMKVPETGTSVFTPTAFSGNDTSGTRSAGLSGFDLLIAKRTASSSLDWVWLDKLRRLTNNRWISSNSTQGEGAEGGTLDTITSINGQYTQDGINITKTSNYSYLDAGSSDYIWYALKRAPGFFDEVCYTGTGSSMTLSHNLAVSPELIILKERNASGGWIVYSSPTGFSVGGNLAGNGAFSSGLAYVSATSSTTFTTLTNASTYVAYLFASLTGVSKVGTYTGNGSSQTINCGFTGGARFVLIKRTDSTGDWYVYDTARGIVSGNDSQLKLNTDATAATGFDAVDPDNSGFIVNNNASDFPINVNAATYIYLAISQT